MDNHNNPLDMTVAELLGFIAYFGSMVGAAWLTLWLLGAV